MLALAAALAAFSTPPADRLPLTGLGPAKATPGLCVYTYRVSTASPECQAFCDQAAGYYYSYIWMEAARNYETALRHDPDCAFAWLGLAKAFDEWKRGSTPDPAPFLAVTGAAFQKRLPDRFARPFADYCLGRAKACMERASHREQLLVRAKLQEKGLWPDTPADERKRKAIQTLDELLTLYDDDEEGWFARAELADGVNGAVPFHKALLRLNPLHPGANHKLVHHFENVRRPALGWVYAENYIASSPGLPHAYHMQAHLATRVGKWRHTTDWSFKAVELERAYHRAMNVRPADDHQYAHHLEVLTKTLVHDGRFAEADAIRAEAERNKYTFRPEWFRAALSRQDWPAAGQLVADLRKTDKPAAAYYAALLALDQGDTARAAAEADVLRHLGQSKKGGRTLELRLWEVQGRLACATGHGEAGVKLLRRAVDKTKDDFTHHAWGNGAYYMEAWGLAALDAGLAAEAEEAFLEALAHDSGSVRAALGLQALCTRLDRPAEASAYLKLAARAWAKAAPADFDRLREGIIRRAGAVPAGGVAVIAPRKTPPLTP